MSWNQAVEEEPEAKRSLIRDSLEKATELQLLAVRGYLTRHSGAHGYDSTAWIIEEGIKAFDSKRYDDPHISFLVREGELVDILVNPGNLQKYIDRANKIRVFGQEMSN
jgi:hypothetical protein